jgi:probable HAF family extracellular repeat protein
MKQWFGLCAAAILSAGCGGARNALPQAAQPVDSSAFVRADGEYPSYRVSALPSLGGGSAAGNSINSLGWVAGVAALSGSGSSHAAVWRHGTAQDLGTLGGANSGVEWQVNNDRGVVAGISETATADPLNESWSCSAFIATNGHTCLGFVWKNRVMTPLSTLGGNNGYAAGVNQRGAIVGWAETSLHDPTCVAPTHVLQFLPVVWEPDAQRTVRQLQPLGDDPDGAAVAINDAGQIAGISGTCDRQVGRFSARHAVLWERGVPHDLGSLGGVAWNTPTAINQGGAVVGFSDLRGDRNGNPKFHAFYWTKAAGMVDIGTLPGDKYSEALGINDQGVVVGVSYSAGFRRSRAFIWQGGKRLTNLQTLLPRDSGLTLLFANSINDGGRITGEACIPSSGGCSSAPAFLAVPER